MKPQSLKIGLVFMFALALMGAAFAADTIKGTFQISAPTAVSGTTLPAGEYVARWSGSGPAVQVTITRNGTAVATVPATIVASDHKASASAAEIQNDRSGKRELTALRFSGKAYSLRIGGAAAEAKSAESLK
jgi:2-methylaconitate cis-trans-isomerase PrpF